MSDVPTPSFRTATAPDLTSLIREAATSARKRSGAGGADLRPELANPTRTTATPSYTATKPTACRGQNTETDTPLARHERRSRALALQERSGQLLGDDHRTCQCGKVAAYDGGRKKRKARVEIKSNAQGVAYVSGLMRCGSVWTCPVCAARIAQVRRDELAKAARLHVERGGMVYLLTLTVPHAHDDLAHVLTGQLLEAYNRMTSGRGAFSRSLRPWSETVTRQKDGQRWREVVERPAGIEDVGYLGQVRALEVTHGKNGWHPHLHVLLFVDASMGKVVNVGTTERPDERVQGTVWDELFSRWAVACEAVGLDTPDERACSLQDGTHAAQYVSKWGAADELARAHVKTARGKGKTPWQLLEQATLLRGTPAGTRAGHLFREFAHAFQGRRQLYWTPGLRDALDLGQEVSDEDAAEQAQENHWDVADRAADLVVLTISWDSWALVMRYRERADLLHVAEVSGAAGARRFIRCLRRRFAMEHAGEVWRGAA